MAHVLTNHCLETCRVGAVSEAGDGDAHTTDGGAAGEGESSSKNHRSSG